MSNFKNQIVISSSLLLLCTLLLTKIGEVLLQNDQIARQIEEGKSTTTAHKATTKTSNNDKIVIVNKCCEDNHVLDLQMKKCIPWKYHVDNNTSSWKELKHSQISK